MIFAHSIITIGLVCIGLSAAYPLKPRGVDPSLVPEFGIVSGLNPTGTGDCSGAVPGVEIPCDCPPDRTLFINDLNANIAAGRAVNNSGIGAFVFPTDNSIQSALARLTAASVTLQNLVGPGVGCPVSSTTFSAQSAALEAQLKSGATTLAPASASSVAPATPPAASTTPAPAPAPTPATSPQAAIAVSNSGTASAAQVAALAPQIGFSAGLNPTGTGNCQGVLGPTGPEIPCSCPPSQADFVAALQANVAAGEAIHNPTVKIKFPTDNSNASQAARIEAGIVTIQNLSGPGVGCPAVSTTFSAQLAAVQR